jgi:hypothetical protein
MASEIRVNTINNRSGLGTISITNSGAVFSGVTTFAQIQTTSGEVTVGTGASVFSPATNVLALGTNNAERVRITSTGSVGIGTDNPSRSLDICFDSESGIELRNNTANKNLQFLVKDDGTGRIVQPSDRSLQFDRAGTVSAVITSTGLVGIGTDIPGSAFEVFGAGAVANVKANGATNARVRITSGNAQSSFLEFGDSDDTDVGEIVYDHSDNHMHFTTNTSERLRITSGGNIGIGTDTPGAVLEVFDATSNTIINVKSGDAGVVLNLIDPSQRSSIEQNGTTLKIISDTGAEFASSDIRLQVDGSTKMRVESTGNIAIDNGNLVFSTSGTGIDFSATANGPGTTTSELLDDYEEGTWTPSIQGIASLAAAYGHYIKVGNIVHVVFYVEISSTKTYSSGYSGTSPFDINMPFQCNNLSNAYWGAHIGNIRYIDFSTGSPKQFSMNIGNDRQVLTGRWIKDNSNWDNATLGDLYATFSMHGSVTYSVD